MDGSTVILGIEIPSTDPVFLGIIAIHIPLGLACVIAGAIAMLSAKGRGRHSIVGRVYYWCLGALFVSATLLAVMRWAENYHLFVFGALAFSSAWLGHRAIQKRWPYWTRMHITGMGLSYTWMLVAFYVDNGPQLPIWKDLPHFTYWLLPLAVGLPLIIRALASHPFRRLGDLHRPFPSSDTHPFDLQTQSHGRLSLSPYRGRKSDPKISHHPTHSASFFCRDRVFATQDMGRVAIGDGSQRSDMRMLRRGAYGYHSVPKRLVTEAASSLGD